MTTAATITNSLHSLRLFSPPSGHHHHTHHGGTPGLTSTATSTSSSTQQHNSNTDNSDSNSTGSSSAALWPAAVDALALRLWECGRSALGKSIVESGIGDNQAPAVASDGRAATPALCDGPYVRVDYVPPDAKKSSHRPQHMQQPPISNPFKTLLLKTASSGSSNSTTATALSSSSSGDAANADACNHCRQGNFLEFCFSRDHCRCMCHEECPCNPCADIRQQRHRSASATDSSTPLSTPPSTRVQSKESLDSTFRPFGDVAAVKPVVLHSGRKRHQRDYENARLRVSKIWADEKRRLCSMPTS